MLHRLALIFIFFIILHNPMDRASRDFVAAWGSGNTVLSYPNCLEQYPVVSAFPSVVVTYPAYYQASDNGTGRNMPAGEEIMRLPGSMQEVLDRKAVLDKRAADNPPR